MTNISGYLLAVQCTRRQRIAEALKNGFALIGIVVTLVMASKADYSDEKQRDQRTREHNVAHTACKAAGARYADLLTDEGTRVYICTMPRGRI